MSSIPIVACIQKVLFDMLMEEECRQYSATILLRQSVEPGTIDFEA